MCFGHSIDHNLFRYIFGNIFLPMPHGAKENEMNRKEDMVYIEMIIW